MITFQNLTKTFSGCKTSAVDNISLHIKKGDVFGFLGPNGAGKTTTVKMLVGLISPTSGTVSLLGASPKSSEVKKNIGFLPEHPYFYQYLTAREFLEMCAQIFQIPKQEVTKRIETILEEVKLVPGAWNRKIYTYSKGMQQRVGLAQALLNDPELVILDEPMSGLDPLGRKELKDAIVNLKKKGKTIFFNSHILSDVEDLCTRIAIIDRGKIILEGEVKEITNNRKRSLEEVFVEMIQKNREGEEKAQSSKMHEFG